MQNRLLARIDKHLFNVFEKMRMGSWYCESCEKRSLKLPKRRVGVVEFLVVADESKRPAKKDSNQIRSSGEVPLASQVDSFHDADEHAELQTDEPTPAEPIGNVLRSDQSLLARKARSNRYSEKFRESVVKRVLSGQSTIAQVRVELKVTERDVLDWIAASNARKDDQILELNQTVESLKLLSYDDGRDPVLNSGQFDSPPQPVSRTDPPDRSGEFKQTSGPTRPGPLRKPKLKPRSAPPVVRPDVVRPENVIDGVVNKHLSSKRKAELGEDRNEPREKVRGDNDRSESDRLQKSLRPGDRQRSQTPTSKKTSSKTPSRFSDDEAREIRSKQVKPN